LNLAVEYQGPHHFYKPNYYAAVSKIKRRDKEKRVACKNAGIILVEISYKWQGDADYVLSAFADADIKPDRIGVVSDYPVHPKQT